VPSPGVVLSTVLAEVALAVTGSAQVREWHRPQGGGENWRELVPLLHPTISLSWTEPDPFPLQKSTRRSKSPTLSWCTELCSKQRAVRQKPKPVAVSPWYRLWVNT